LGIFYGFDRADCVVCAVHGRHRQPVKKRLGLLNPEKLFHYFLFISEYGTVLYFCNQTNNLQQQQTRPRIRSMRLTATIRSANAALRTVRAFTCRILCQAVVAIVPPALPLKFQMLFVWLRNNSSCSVETTKRLVQLQLRVKQTNKKQNKTKTKNEASICVFSPKHCPTKQSGIWHSKAGAFYGVLDRARLYGGQRTARVDRRRSARCRSSRHAVAHRTYPFALCCRCSRSNAAVARVFVFVVIS
jgi:hypothetical protein